MAQFGSREENSYSLSSSVITNLRSYFRNSPLMHNVISQLPTMTEREQRSFILENNSEEDGVGLDESGDSLNQFEDSR